MKATIITVIAIIALFVLLWCLFLYYNDRNFRRTLKEGTRVRVYIGEIKYYGTVSKLSPSTGRALIYFPEDGAEIWYNLSDLYAPLR